MEQYGAFADVLELPRVEVLGGGGRFEFRLRLYMHGDIRSQKMVIMYPDRGQSPDGDHGNDLRAALALQQIGYAVLRITNMSPPGLSDADYRQLLINNLIDVTDVLTKEVQGGSTRRLMMMGTGAGASAIAAVAPYQEQVDRILLHAPAAAIDLDTMANALSRFKGQLRIMTGDTDEAAETKRVAERLHQAAGGASLRELVVVIGADRSFSGQVHEAVFLKAALWAFAARDLTVPGAKYDVRSGNTPARTGSTRTGQGPTGAAQVHL